MMNATVEQAVRELIRSFLTKFLADSVPDPATRETNGQIAPFHDALVPGIRLLNERSFSTRLGNLHEKVAAVIARGLHANVVQPLDLVGSIPVLSREFITQRVEQLEHRAAPPDSRYEREQIQAHFGGEVGAGTRIDLFVETQDGKEHYFEIKSAKPNKGQCIEMKQRLLTAFGIRRAHDAHCWWAVPYNPYGEAAYRHVYPLSFFDFPTEVMLGGPFWDFVGGNGTNEQLQAIYTEVGIEFEPVIEALRG